MKHIDWGTIRFIVALICAMCAVFSVGMNVALSLNLHALDANHIEAVKLNLRGATYVFSFLVIAIVIADAIARRAARKPLAD